MSVPGKNTTWGYMFFEGKEYGVLSYELSDEIVEKLKNYQRNNDSHSNITTHTTSKKNSSDENDDLEEQINKIYEDIYTPPRGSKIDWCIEDNQLYLTRLYTDEIHKKISGSDEKVLADWMNEMKLLIDHRRVCKTYEKGNSYLNEMQVLYLKLDLGVIMSKKNETELYTSNELKTYMDRYQSYATLRIDAADLIWYLEDGKSPSGDHFFPIVLDHIRQMTQKGSKDDISLTIEDAKAVLKNSQLAVFGSAIGSDIDEMVGSLVDSMTDEVLEAKGCLMHFTMHKDYPVANIEKIVSGFEKKLGYNKEDPLDAYISNRNIFIFGTRLSDEMEKDEVLIRVLLGI